jgi:hypothetical protein
MQTISFRRASYIVIVEPFREATTLARSTRSGQEVVRLSSTPDYVHVDAHSGTNIEDEVSSRALFRRHTFPLGWKEM